VAKIEAADRRVRRIGIPEEWLLDAFVRQGERLPRCVTVPRITLPDGCRIVGGPHHDMYSRRFVFVIQHDSFTPVPDGECVPVVEEGLAWSYATVEVAVKQEADTLVAGAGESPTPLVIFDEAKGLPADFWDKMDEAYPKLAAADAVWGDDPLTPDAERLGDAYQRLTGEPFYRTDYGMVIDRGDETEYPQPNGWRVVVSYPGKSRIYAPSHPATT
jgi:hypothetical protein